MSEQSGKGEFGRIRDYFAPLTEGHADSFNLLDDAALLDCPREERLVVTTDMIVQGVHYLGDETPEEVAAKALRVNLSDLAAKGASPFAYSVAMALPKDVDDNWVARFAEGLAADQKKFGLRLLGGDSVSTPGPTTISITAYGTVPGDAYPSRAGGKAGDILCISGAIGDGALGLLAAKGTLGSRPDLNDLITRYRCPEPRLGLGLAMRSFASAAMDISDGLVGDLAALAGASGCAAEIQAGCIPLSDSAKKLISDDPELFAMAITGGDDYELLFAIPAQSYDAAMRAAAKENIGLTKVGTLTDKGPAGEVTVLDRNGDQLNFSQEKYTHA